MSGMLSAALEALEAGYSIVPIPPDGSKATNVPWTVYQSRRATAEEATRWFSGGENGLAIIGGPISGNLEWWDFDNRETYAAFIEAAHAVGLGPLVERIRAAFEEETPRGTRWGTKCSETAGNQKLARRPNPEDPRKSFPLIETRGIGGYAIVAPTNGKVHPSGKPYIRKAGTFSTIPTVTPDERQAIIDLARSFDEMPADDEYRPGPQTMPGTGKRPGDAFRDAHGTLSGWREILEPHGWTLTHTRGDVGYWRRPGKSDGWSATTGHAGTDFLYCFSDSTELPAEKALNPFTAYVLLNHAGDFQEAARALSAEGYGEPLSSEPRRTWKAHEERQSESGIDSPQLHPAARYGLAGDVVAAFEPFSESDPAGILASLLVAFGNCCGPAPHTYVSERRHALNLFAALVGATSRSRKGNSWGPIQRVFEGADPDWSRDRQASGIGSGEAVIWAVRDPSEPIEDPKTGQSVILDKGVDDKRLLIQEEELSGNLKVASREGSILSEIERKAWDGGVLQNTVKKSPAKATNPHISILGHVTEEELIRTLTETAQVNGFANRFLWVYVRRSKLLPDSPRLDYQTAGELSARMREALSYARRGGDIRRDPDAAELWRQVYPELTKDAPGMFGALTARAEAHVLRLSMVYALLDCSDVVRVDHLNAALAFWAYCEDSARFIFGDRTGDPIADRIREALRNGGPLSETDIRDLFSRHQKADRIQDALKRLLTAGMAAFETIETGGKPARIWRAVR